LRNSSHFKENIKRMIMLLFQTNDGCFSTSGKPQTAVDLTGTLYSHCIIDLVHHHFEIYRSFS
jgi:hypothetical protein